MRRLAPFATFCAAAFLAAGCGDDEPAGNGGGTSYSDPRLGLEVTEFDEWADSAEVLEDGSTELFGEATVSIEGKGAHQVDAYALIDPVSKGARRTFATTDLDTGVERVFHYEPEDNLIVIGDFDGGVFVYGNPDGTYDVVSATFEQPASEDDYQHAEDGFAAFRLVSDFNEFSTTSPHSAVLALSMARGELFEARTIQTCVEPDCGDWGPGVYRASGPSVCDGFPELCSCVGCWAADKDAEHCKGCAL